MSPPKIYEWKFSLNVLCHNVSIVQERLFFVSTKLAIFNAYFVVKKKPTYLFTKLPHLEKLCKKRTDLTQIVLLIEKYHLMPITVSILAMSSKTRNF